MAAVFSSRSHRLPRPIARSAGTIHLGRHLSDAGESVYKKPVPRTRSVPALSLSRLIFGSLSASPESLLHDRLLFLEYGPGRVSSEQYFLARNRWPAALSAAYSPVSQWRKPLQQ